MTAQTRRLMVALIAATRATSAIMLLVCTVLSVAMPRADAQASPPPIATVDQPRPTGYFVGDLLTQRVLLQQNSQRLTPVTLPPPGRVNSWLERRHAILETDAATRTWLVVEYQLLNAPKAVTAVTIPAWQLPVKSSDTPDPIALKIPAASINIAPLSPPGSPEQVGTRDLRPDHIPARIPTERIQRAAALCTTGFAVTLAAWLGWLIWRNRQDNTTQPFARALRELQALGDGEPRAWQILHRAFDHAAGRVIQSATLPVLFERAPQLIPARAQIEAFYTHSSRIFFASRVTASRAGSASEAGHAVHSNPTTLPSGDQAARAGATGDPGPAPVTGTAKLPLTLCLHLRRLEKRHER